MRGPTPVHNCLTPLDTFGSPPLPPLKDPGEDLERLDDKTKRKISEADHENVWAMEGHQAKFTFMVGSCYSDVSSAFLSLDNNLTLTSELMGHVEGTLNDLASNKLLSLLIIRKYRQKKDEGAGLAKGLLGQESHRWFIGRLPTLPSERVSLSINSGEIKMSGKASRRLLRATILSERF